MQNWVARVITGQLQHRKMEIHLARIRKQPEERKADLVEAAHTVFRTTGYAAANVTDIVKEAGVAQGTFYVYFDSKEAVFDAVAENIVLVNLTNIKQLTGRDDLSAIEKLVGSIRIIMSAEVLERWADETDARNLRHMRDRIMKIASDLYLPVVIDIIKQGVAEGSIDVPYPEATAAYFVGASLLHLDTYKGTEPLTGEQWLAAYLDFVVKIFGIKSSLDFGIID